MSLCGVWSVFGFYISSLWGGFFIGVIVWCGVRLFYIVSVIIYYYSSFFYFMFLPLLYGYYVIK